MKCFICGGHIKKKGRSHLKRCAGRHKLNMSAEEIKLNFLLANSQTPISRKLLHKLYVDQKQSIRELGEVFGLGYYDICFIVEQMGIRLRNIKQSNSTIRGKNLRKETCLQRHGIENPSQARSVKEKKKQTFLENYGVDNVWKWCGYQELRDAGMLAKYGQRSVPNLYGNADFWGWKNLSEEEKSKRSRDRYWRWWNSLSEEEKRKYLQTRSILMLDGGFSSSLEIRIKQILIRRKIPHIWQYWIDSKSYDFKILEANLILEIQGDFWHANPHLYRPDDMLHFPEGHTEAEDVWKRDQKKRELAEKHGYFVFYIWESDIKQMNDSELDLWVTEILETCYENCKDQINQKSKVAV